jgi:hypothetical protein
MKQSFSLAFALFVLATSPAQAQHHPFPATPPDAIVNYLWTMATTGQLLTTEGMNKAAAYYADPGTGPKDKSFLVVSNFWGWASVVKERTTGNRAEVVLEYWPAGKIDSRLRYTPPAPSRAYKFATGYELTLTPVYITHVGPDGKTVISQEPTGDHHWEIVGPLQPRFATINAAIRYVLEMRDITKDSIIKQNADKTLAILLSLDDLYRKQKVPPSACACD